MLNIDDLEQRYKKYKFKRYAPYIKISTIALIVTSLSAFYIFKGNEENKDKNSNIKEHVLKKNEVKTKEPILEKKENNASIAQTQGKEPIDEKENNNSLIQTSDKEHTEEKSIVLTPSLDFLKNIAQQQEPVKNKEPLKVNKTTPGNDPQTLNKMDKRSDSFTIKRRDRDDDIKYVIERFNISKNPALSLFVAKKYYYLGNYEQAYNYALKTNEIDNNMEDSWIIFSRSLVKMNKKEQAVRTLKKYISYSDSISAKQLLDEILSGKFK